MSELQRAALIVEMSDGTRLLYELHGPISQTTEHEYEYEYEAFTEVPVRVPIITRTRVTVEATLGRATMWAGDMPTAEQKAIAG